jgi:hypothetical protein
MYWQDHTPPHFHAIYGQWEAAVSIETCEVIAGQLPRRAQRLVRVWASEHRPELLANWRRAQRGEPLRSIEPLE